MHNLGKTMSREQALIEEVLKPIDVKINGDRPWDIQVKDPRVFKRIAASGSLGFGESYMDGWWECDQLDELISRLMAARVREHFRFNLPMALFFAKAFLTNAGKRSKAFEIGERHYDVGNDLYKLMLDKRMVYTCAYWKNATTLDEAQEAKLDLVCRKIGLKAGDKVLDIGCGWGSFARYAAEKYGAKVVGISVSKEQIELAREMHKGFDVEFRLQDYRDVNEKFDHIISLGMFEHVGYKQYREYMEIVHRNLKDDGLFLLHTMGHIKTMTNSDPWIDKYIFPNSLLPYITQIGKSTEKLFVMEDWHNFGADYDTTLMAWFKNFDNEWPQLKEKYGEKFYRMWKFYLMVFAGNFRCRNLQLWQIVFSKNGIRGGYQSVR